jgi:hypothetical protein
MLDKKYDFSNLTDEDKTVIVRNLLKRSLNLRTYYPQDKKLKEGYLKNSDELDKILEKVGALTSKDWDTAL